MFKNTKIRPPSSHTFEERGGPRRGRRKKVSRRRAFVHLLCESPYARLFQSGIDVVRRENAAFLFSPELHPFLWPPWSSGPPPRRGHLIVWRTGNTAKRFDGILWHCTLIGPCPASPLLPSLTDLSSTESSSPPKLFSASLTSFMPTSIKDGVPHALATFRTPSGTSSFKPSRSTRTSSLTRFRDS